MQSSQARLISGAVVTFLLLALVALITFTLLRNDAPLAEGAQPTMEGAPGAVTEVATPDPALAETSPEAVAASETTAPGEAEPAATQELSPDAATETPVETPAEVSAEATVADAADEPTATSAPDIAITIQPTPTRRVEDAAETDAPATLPAVDPASAPTDPLLAFANPNFVNDLLWLDGALWTASNSGATRWEIASEEVERWGLAEGLQSPRLRKLVYCPLEGLGIVFGSDAGLEVFDPESGAWTFVGATEDGLPFADIRALACNTEAQRLAVASPDGVALLDADGGDWRTVEDDDALLNEVRALALADDGTLWAASGTALVQVVADEVVTVYDADNSPLTGESVTDVALGGGETLWVTAGERLFNLTDGEWEVYRNASQGGDFPTSALIAVEPASNGRAWIASQTAEICRFDPEFGACSPWYAQVEGMAQSSLSALAVGDDGALAYATAGSGSSVLSGSRWTTLAGTTTFPLSNRTFALGVDASGYVWVAGSSGVQQVDPGAPQDAVLHASDDHGPSAINVRSLFADASGGIWLGGMGASYFDGAAWTNYTQSDGLVGEEITAVTQDSQGRVWFGTRAGLSIWTGSTFFNLTAENGLPDAQILSLAADANSVWIGSASGGLYRFENNQLQVLTQENVGLPSDRILSLLVASDRSLYVGTDQGLARFARGEFTPISGVPSEAITSLAQGSDGALWAATAEHGLWTQPAGAQPTRAWTQAESEAGALPTAIRTITVDGFGGVWIGTDDAGLVRYAP